MKNKLFKLSVIGFVFVSIIGSISHFIFEWSGYSRIIGLFFPVNESTWEHLKLLLLPYLVWAVIEYFALKRNKIFFSKAVGAATGMLSITAIFYTYSGIVGNSIETINILSFFIGVLTAFAVDYFMIKSDKFNKAAYNIIGIIMLIIFVIIFILFTLAPPLIPLFRDPVNLSYGI